MSRDLDFVALDRRHDLCPAAIALNDASWPTFLRHDPMSARYGRAIYDVFPAHQIAAVDPSAGVVAIGNGVPVSWEEDADALPDEGWDWAIERAFDDIRRGRRPTVVCALSISVAADRRGEGLGAAVLEAFRNAARSGGFGSVVAPVRPSLKTEEPSMPMAEYVERRDGEGSHADPWVRAHERVGGQIVRICPRSMLVAGSVADWSMWTGLSFPESGEYPVEGGLVPARIDLDADRGSYVEPNVWMVHPLV